MNEKPFEKEFDSWFRVYLLNKTSSCWDRDVLRWAKPVLEIGYYLQGEVNDDGLPFKGSQVLLDAKGLLTKVMDEKDLLTVKNKSLQDIIENQQKEIKALENAASDSLIEDDESDDFDSENWLRWEKLRLSEQR